MVTNRGVVMISNLNHFAFAFPRNLSIAGRLLLDLVSESCLACIIHEFRAGYCRSRDFFLYFKLHTCLTGFVFISP